MKLTTSRLTRPDVDLKAAALAATTTAFTIFKTTDISSRSQMCHFNQSTISGHSTRFCLFTGTTRQDWTAGCHQSHGRHRGKGVFMVTT